MSMDRWWKLQMTLKLHTNNGCLELTTAASITIKEIIDQLEQGSLVLIETIYGSTFIVNCMNINAIEIFSNTKLPPISK